MEHYYLSIKGSQQGQFKGTPNVRGSNDWMVGVNVSMQATIPHDPATGLATGKRRHLPLTIIKPWDAASPQILQAFVTREVLTPVILEFMYKNANGEEAVWQRITLTNAAVLDIRRYADFSAAQTGSTINELEEISLAWQKISVDDLLGKTQFVDSWSEPS